MMMLWFNKKDEKTSECKKNNDCGSSPNEVPIVVPAPEEVKFEFNGKISDHEEFNVIIEDNKTRFRIKSSFAHEIVRLNCVTEEYKFDEFVTSTGETRHFVKRIDFTPYVKRLFITDSGRFFFQVIRRDNTSAYVPMSHTGVQRQLSVWESSDRLSNPLQCCQDPFQGHWVVSPGTYSGSSNVPVSNQFVWNWASYVESYEVINQELYDTKLIEVF